MRVNLLSSAPRVLLAGLALVATTATAQTTPESNTIRTVSIHLDPAKTEITFAAGTIRRIHGSFALKQGVVALDTASGVAQGEILADAESEKGNSKSMDKKIRDEVLQVSTFPGISFHPEKVSGTLPAADGETHLKLQGSFTIHGTDHPLDVDVDAVRQGGDILLKSSFDVPYVQWGMKDVSTFLMRDRNVRITVISHGTLEAPHA